MIPWSCDPARMARWQAIDRERAARTSKPKGSATWVVPPPKDEAPRRERFTPKPGVVVDFPCAESHAGLLRGPKSI